MSFAEQVTDFGPVVRREVLSLARVRECAQVVDERVDPDPGDLIRSPRQRHPPGLAGPADAEILEPALDEASRLVVPNLRQHEVGPLVVEREEPILVGREAKEVVLLLDPLGRNIVHGALAVDELRLGLELLAADAVEPRVDALVDVAVVVEPLQEVLDECLVLFVGRANEEIELRVDPPRQLLPVLDDPIGVLLWLEALLFGHAGDLGRMLVGAGQEERVVASLPVMAHDDVPRDGRVRMTDVRGRVDVVDRGRQVEAHRGQ